MHRVHVSGARPPWVVVTSDDAHHIVHVLRLGVGDGVIVFDGRGHQWSGRIASTARSDVTIDLGDERKSIPEPPVHVTLGVAVLKGAHVDDVVRDSTMLGASAIVPFVSAHVAVPERAWKNRSTARWVRVAAASSSQCGRAVVPEVHAVTTFDALLLTPGFDAIVICVEPASGAAPSASALPRPARALVLVGPEGGWAPQELERARAAGAVFVSLGPRTLRAETAPVVALSALWTAWGWE